MIVMHVNENIGTSSSEPVKGALVETITLPVGNALQYLVWAFRSNQNSKIIKADLDEVIVVVTRLPSDARVLDELKKSAFSNGPSYESYFGASAGRYPSYVLALTSDTTPTLHMHGLDALHDLAWTYLTSHPNLRTNGVMAQLAE